MAGHSHWAGIKHKKGKADKERSKIFSKLSKEITVAAKLGDKNTIKYAKKLILKINTKLKKYGPKSKNLIETLNYILSRNK